jgi:putative tryptophan/tyrosine transport system substrate-binding protein
VTNRRGFLRSGTALLLAGSAWGQPSGKVRRVGIVTTAAGRGETPFYLALEARLGELGYVEGKNLILIWESAGTPQKMEAMAAEIARQSPEVMIAAGSEQNVRAVRRSAGNLPIVMVAVDFDPVERNFIDSLARPGANITGLFLRQVETAGKRVELIKEALPAATRIAMLYDTLTRDQFEAAQSTAKRIGLAVLPFELGGESYNYQGPIEQAAKQQVHAILSLSSGRFYALRDKIVGAAFRRRLPVIANTNWADSGALVSYGTDFSEMYRRAADYVDSILKGAKPADLPVEQAAKHELIINLKTAKALGINLPRPLLLRASRTID